MGWALGTPRRNKMTFAAQWERYPLGPGMLIRPKGRFLPFWGVSARPGQRTVRSCRKSVTSSITWDMQRYKEIQAVFRVSKKCTNFHELVFSAGLLWAQVTNLRVDG